MNRNDRAVFIIFLLLAFLFIESAPLWSENIATPFNRIIPDINVNTIIPAFMLPKPEKDVEKQYLGLSGTGDFEIGQIKAQVLIIEVFSFYCPHCQQLASRVNELYQNLQELSDVKGKIKMIGIGVSNSAYEVDLYKKNYDVPFPLFPDHDKGISQKFNVKGTPTFIMLKLNKNGLHEQVYFQEGGFEDVHQFLTEIIKLSGLRMTEKPQRGNE